MTIDDIDPDDLRAMFDAGVNALTFNAPLSLERAGTFADWLAARGATSVVDLGCGRGAFCRLVASRLDGSSVIGVDTSEALIASARHHTSEVGLSDRVRFEVADASAWSGDVDASVCIGASHAFEGPEPMFAHMAGVGSLAVVGDGLWLQDPDQWHIETFGEMPDGLDGISELATSAGWTVESAELSSLAEWDHFESTWVSGVRSIGTDDAEMFAQVREAESLRYRSTLGFGWLLLSR